jgi:hypothetical protein
MPSGINNNKTVTISDSFRIIIVHQNQKIMARITDNGLKEIPSEFIEPYLATFMGSMVEFIASANTAEEKAKRNGLGWTVDEIKNWVKGVEVFVSMTCGIHARYAMMNEMHRFIEMPNDELQKVCKKVTYGETEK